MYVFIFKLHKSVDLPITHTNEPTSADLTGFLAALGLQRYLMEGMMAAELAELSACVPYPPKAVLLLFIYLILWTQFYMQK